MRLRGLRWLQPDARALTCARVGVLLVALLAAGVPAARAAGDDVVVEVTDTGSLYHVHGMFALTVPIETAWQVLADYEHIGAFVKSIKTSEFVAGPGGERVLRQDAVVGVFPFRRSVRVELKVEEEAERRRIEFEDVLKRDFHHYEGAWQIYAGEIPGTVVVDYSLEADPVAGVPAMIGRGAMSRSARDLLVQVRAEIGRRGEGGR